MRRVAPLITASVVLVALLLVPGVGGAATAGAPKPAITAWKIPFPAKRKHEMKAYALRHYGIKSFRLKTPHVIVEHVSETSSAQAVYNTFAPDHPDSELHELPGVCAHFVIGSDGKIYQLVNLNIMCRHTVGLNYTAIGIEHVGFADSDVLNNSTQMRASLALTNWLRCHYGIKITNVIGHNESLSSPYHHENVAALRNQTHSDMKHPAMRRYRRLLSKRHC